jgi:serine/threonine-protein kinase
MSTDENLERLRVLFEQSLDQPESECDAWLQRQCAQAPDILARLRRLIAQHRKPVGVLANDAVELLGRLLPNDDPAAGLIGTDIGPYRLIRLLGEGGMGRVYLAERVDGQFSHQVALKLVRGEFATLELHQRFLRERDTLARLAHPNIAQLHDGGVSASGAPYFTLELIEGEPITRWCDERTLDIPGRLRLMMKVCDAVQYAHRNLIVHRDLKPSNILVTASGEPKLLDFGIAKPLAGDSADGLTNTQATPMTREYAAPEQLLGDPVTTATDVYALGVLLYLLLCGHMPYRRAAQGVISWTKAILEEPPEPLDRAVNRETEVSNGGFSAKAGITQAVGAETLAAVRGTSPQGLQRALRGDLERIVQRALAKLPEARYATISAMADDLRASLDGRPISGGTRTYRLRKFVRRHWLSLTAAATLLLVVLGSAMGMAWQATQIEREARSTTTVKNFLFGLFAAVDPNEAKGKDISARELLDRGAQRIDTNIRDEPALQAELRGVLGRIYYHLGMYAQAGELQQRAIDTLKTAAGAQPLLLAQTQFDRANTLRQMGDLKGAAAEAADASRLLQTVARVPAEERVRALNTLSKIATSKRDFAQAKSYADAGLALAQPASVDDALRADILTTAGNAEYGLTSLDRAEAHFRAALSLVARSAGADAPLAALLHTSLGMVLRRQSRYVQALGEDQQAMAIDQRVYGPQHPRLLQAQASLGLTHYHLGHYRQARELLEQALAGQRTQFGADNPAVAGTLINLGLVLTEIPDLDKAEASFAEALGIWQAKYGRDFDGVQTALGDLGYVHMMKGQYDRAETELLDVDSQNEKRGFKDDYPNFYRLGELSRLRGNVADARRWDQQGLQLAQKDGGENTRFTALAHHYLGLALRDSGDVAGAQRELRAALASFAGYIPKGEHPLAATTRLELARLLAKDASTHDQAQQLLSEAVAIRGTFLGDDDLRTREARDALAQLQRPR